jgi:hypothetical protein
MAARVHDAAALARLASSWGHAPTAAKGRRIAGYYYLNDDAQRADVFPAHCMGATRELVLFLANALDATPNNDLPTGNDGGRG